MIRLGKTTHSITVSEQIREMKVLLRDPNPNKFLNKIRNSLITVDATKSDVGTSTYSWCDTSLYPFTALDITQMKFLDISEFTEHGFDYHQNFYFSIPQEHLTVMLIAYCEKHDIFYGVYFEDQSGSFNIGEELARNFIFTIYSSDSEDGEPIGRARIRTSKKKLIDEGYGVPSSASLEEILLQLYGMPVTTNYGKIGLEIHHEKSIYNLTDGSIELLTCSEHDNKGNKSHQSNGLRVNDFELLRNL